MPTPTIPNGAPYMAATLYTGDNASSKTITGVGFQPDFVWIKARNIAYSNVLYDVVRGTGNTKNLSSDSTSAEPAFSSNANLTSFDSNGFTVGSTASTNIINGNTTTYVSWNWKAGGTAVSNTSGTITSQVSANTTSGFSVVTFAAAANGTVGHGLGATPSLVILKSRTNGTNYWLTYHVSTGATGFLALNTADAFTTNSTTWNNTAPTSLVFTLGSGITSGGYGNCVAYCWSQIAGYSAFGSYTGNGSTDGTFIYTGLRPKYVMIKRTDSAGGWMISDTSRYPYNVVNGALEAQSSSAEFNNDSYYQYDIVSNGIKIRGTSSAINSSGGTYIYACFAENPFKLSRAR